MKNIICPECKNEVDLGDMTNLEEKQVFECNYCGINLMVTGVTDEGGEEVPKVEIVEEGK